MNDGLHAEILWRVEGAAGVIVLNRPAALNALTLNMVRQIDVALDAFERSPQVTRVVVRGAGEKAFCAGGDIRLLYEQGKAGDHAAQLAFWREEYILNMRIKHFSKPIISLINGIVMGGGVGVSQHGTFRVASESYVFAMPEVGIGFFPDVGATFFLPRLPDGFGMMLALTGARVKVADAVAFGLVDAHVPLEKFDALEASLAAGEDVATAVGAFSVPVQPGPYYEHRAQIAQWFAPGSPVGVMARLKLSGSDLATRLLAEMSTKSALSIAIAGEQMRRGAALDFDEAMRIEYRVVSRICKSQDFYEGVRTVLIEKGATPHWEFAEVGLVPEARIAAMFAPLPSGELG